MNILVTGSNGMLGRDLVPALQAAGHTVLATTHSTLDITDASHVEHTLQAHTPDVVINCAAYTAVDKAETEKDACTRINVTGVEHLVRACAQTGTTLMQLSTDYVFDGTQESYNENSVQHPINHYGATKALAEQHIGASLQKHYIVRTSWLFGKHGKNFIETIHSICKTTGAAQVVDDQHGRPTYTVDLAQALCTLLDKPYGTYHITNSGSCTWYELAREAMQYADTCNISPCSSAAFVRPAQRPTYSILNNNKLPALPTWQDAVQRYMEDRT